MVQTRATYDSLEVRIDTCTQVLSYLLANSRAIRGSDARRNNIRPLARIALPSTIAI